MPAPDDTAAPRRYIDDYRLDSSAYDVPFAGIATLSVAQHHQEIELRWAQRKPAVRHVTYMIEMLERTARQLRDDLDKQLESRETRLLLAKAQIKSALQMLAEFPEDPPTRGIIATLLEAVEHLRAVKP